MYRCGRKQRDCGQDTRKTLPFLQALGDPLIDSVVSENIPLLTADEKFNETVTSIARRVEAVLTSESHLYRISWHVIDWELAQDYEISSHLCTSPVRNPFLPVNGPKRDWCSFHSRTAVLQGVVIDRCSFQACITGSMGGSNFLIELWCGAMLCRFSVS